MDNYQFFPSQTVPVTPSQFFPPPGFPATNFYVPPPTTPGVPIENLQVYDIENLESIINTKRGQQHSQGTKHDDVPQIKLHEFSQRIKEFYRSLRKLKNMMEDLKSHPDSDDLREKINAGKVHMSTLRASLHIYITNIQILKKKISKRRRKRKKKFNVSIGLSARQIAANHMQRLQRIASDIEQDEKLKKDADNILLDVLRKKNEVGNCIQLLNTLERLHFARCNCNGVDARNSGFINVIEKLKILWETRLKEYAVEEKGFRVMLEELAVDRKKESNQTKDKMLGEWFKSIFGVSDSRILLFYSNVDEFIRIRHDWDKYIVEDGDVNLKIPPGWILPEDRCNSAWKKFICK